MARRRPSHLIASMAAAAVVLLPAIAVGVGSAGSASAADEQSDAVAARSNSAWLAGQLDAGAFPNPLNPSLPDYGLMIDAVFSMYASGDGRLAEPIIDRLDDKKEARRFFTYFGFGEGQDWLQNEGLDDRVGGATAKVLVAAETAGRDPRDFGGYDMVEQTQDVIVHPEDVEPGGRFAAGSTVNPLFTLGAREVGRVVDYGPTTSYNNANTFGQALAVVGLAGAKAGDQSVVDKLTWQQCSEGYFRIFYSYDAKTNELQTCDEGQSDDPAKDFSAPDRDSTGFALSAMAAARQAGATGLDEPIQRAVSWLEKEQTADGGWGGGVSTEAPNTNSTGLVVQGLADAGADAEVIAKGAAYLRSAQVTAADAATALKDDIGAIGYQPEGYEAAKADGITGLDTWIRASAQASLGLSRASFWQLVTGTVPDPAPTPDPSPTATATPTTKPTPTSTKPTLKPTSTPTPTKTSIPAVTGTPTSTPSPSPSSTPAPTRTTAPLPPRGAVVVSGAGRPAGSLGLPPASRQTAGQGVTRPSAITATGAATVDPADASTAERVGRYLAGSLVGGTHVEVRRGTTTYVDYDTTADVVLALRNLDQQPQAVRAASAFLLSPESVAAYANGQPYEKTGAAYAEPLGKLALISALSGSGGTATSAGGSRGSAAAGDPTSARPTTPAATLKAALQKLVSADGSFTDSGAYADRSASTERHVWATLGLAAVGGDTTAATAALAAGQCADGGFPALLGSAVTSCRTGDAAASGWAAQALNVAVVASPATSTASSTASSPAPSAWPAARRSAVDRARGYLVKVPSADGLVHGTGGAPDLATTGAVAAGRQMTGLDTSDTVRAASRLVRPDGSLAKTGAGTGDLGLTLAGVPALTGRSTALAPGSTLAVGVRPEAAATLMAVQPAADGSGWWQRWWPWLLVALLAGAVGALVRPAVAAIGAARHPGRHETPSATTRPST